MNADELRGTEMDLMQIRGKKRALPECAGAQRRSAAGIWNDQVDVAAHVGDDGDEEQWWSFELLQC